MTVREDIKGMELEAYLLFKKTAEEMNDRIKKLSRIESIG